MGTYAQWRALADAGEIRRVTWVCGDQRVLVEEVVDTTRAILKPGDLDYVPLSHTSTFDRDVWAAANQYPLNPGSNRLLVIRDADKIKRWDLLDGWLSRTRNLPGVYLLFVSAEPTLPTDGGGKGGGRVSAHLAALKAPRGSLVKCSIPNEGDAVRWVCRRAEMDDDTASYLLTRAGGDLRTVAAVCAKVALFDGRPGKATIDALCTERPAADFTDCLLSLDKKKALLAVPDLAKHDRTRLVALLDSRLDALHLLHRAQLAGHSVREVAGVNPYLARQYMPIARHYDRTSCVNRRRVLAVVDDAIRTGADVGVFESLVALW